MIASDVRILVLHEKHGDRYFLIRSEAHLRETALHVLSQRVEEGWIFENEDDELWPRVKQAIDTNDAPLALQMLLARDSYEYEGCEVIRPHEVM